MKTSPALPFLSLFIAVGLLMGGCLLKPARTPTHYFILAPLAPSEPVPPRASPMALEVGPVKMPGFLLRNSMMVRQSPTEIAYLENALWAERLDQSFRRTLAENLAGLLASEQSSPGPGAHPAVRVRLSVEVEQFEVDCHGQGTLVAGWRLSSAGGGSAPTSGQARLTRAGPSPRAKPEVIADTLSALTADFSRQLALELRAAAQAKP